MDREKVKTGIFEMLQRNTWNDIDKERHRFQPVLNDALTMLKEQRITVEIVAVTKENGSVNLFAFRESKDAIKCFCYWKEKGATVTSGEVDIQ